MTPLSGQVQKYLLQVLTLLGCCRITSKPPWAFISTSAWWSPVPQCGRQVKRLLRFTAHLHVSGFSARAERERGLLNGKEERAGNTQCSVNQISPVSVCLGQTPQPITLPGNKPPPNTPTPASALHTPPRVHMGALPTEANIKNHLSHCDINLLLMSTQTKLHIQGSQTSSRRTLRVPDDTTGSS